MFSFFQRWHKRIGIITALFVILLAISGIALNHSEQLRLNDSYIKYDWLLDFYEIKPQRVPVSFSSNENWATQIDQRIYFNNIEIANNADQLYGLINIDNLFVIAMDNQLVLLTAAGEIIEHISGTEGVPAGMHAIGVSDQNNIIIKAAHGFYRVELDRLEWEELDHLEANWSEKKPTPAELKSKLLKQYRGSGLTLERVLFDLHSGRILGAWGVYLIDLAAILFLLLAVSGAWMWWLGR